MKAYKLSFCFQTIFLATGLYFLFDYFGPKPSSRLTLLLVLISAVWLQLMSSSVRLFKALWRKRREKKPLLITITEEEKESDHEELSNG